MKRQGIYKILATGLIIAGTIQLPNIPIADSTGVIHAHAEEAVGTVKLINGGFEDPAVSTASSMRDANTVPGWSTTDPTQKIEIMRSFNGVTPAEGKQWVELNAYNSAALYQDVATIPGTVVHWSVQHRGRDGVDTAVVEFGAPDGPLITQTTMTDDLDAWGTYTGTYIVPEGQTITRFAFEAIDSTGGIGMGNWLDNIVFATQSVLEMTGSFSDADIAKNQLTTYNLTVTNKGGTTAVNNQFSLTLPSETNYVSGSLSASNDAISAENYDPATHTLTFTLASIPDGENVAVSLDLKGENYTTGSNVSTSVSYQDQGFPDQIYQAAADDSKLVIDKGELPVFTGEDLSIKVGETFDPLAGMSVTDMEDGDLTNRIDIVENPVDPNTAGTYTIKYRVTDSSDNSVEFERQVTVRTDTQPTISGEGHTSVKAGTSFDPLAGIQVIDKEDGDLTNSVQVSGSVDVNTPGDYLLSYTVTDSDGNTTTFDRTVTVKSNEQPTITGETASTVKANTDFDPLDGITAFDNEDGDLSKAVQVSGSVDMSTPGDYSLVYTVTDSDGNTTTFTRTVTVKSNEKPVIQTPDTSIKKGSSFDPLEGIRITDAEDGDLTDKAIISGTVDTNVPGDYTLTYTVTDSDGNTVSFDRVVTVETNEEPAMILDGSDSITKGSSFDPFDGVRIIDAEDGDLTDKAVVSGTVDTNVPGDYTLTYTVTDSDGNVISFTRTIHVTEQADIVNPDDKNDPAQGTSVTPAGNNSNTKPAPSSQAADSPTNTALPKTGDAPVWPWSVTGGLLLLLGAAGLSRTKTKKN